MGDDSRAFKILTAKPTRIFGPKMGRLHNEEFHSFYHSPNIVRVIKSIILRWTGLIARMEEGRSDFKILTVTPTGKRPRPRRRLEDNIRMDLKEIRGIGLIRLRTGIIGGTL